MAANVFNHITGRHKTVKNLGWLLRNWKDILTLHALPCTLPGTEAILVANLHRHTYSINFASKTVLEGFINRPVFKGLSINWFGVNKTV